MRLLNVLYLGLGTLILTSSAGSAPSTNDPLNGLDSTKDLASRQLSDPFTTTNFLRRGFQTSVIVKDWVYLDGGDFAYLENGVPNYYHCGLTCDTSTPLKAQSPETAFILGGTDEVQKSELPFGGMVQFNLHSHTFLNKSAACCDATDGIHRGVMHFIPSFGPSGLLIAMGGQNGIGARGDLKTLIDFSVVSVFDPTKQAWWNQTTTGTPPASRIEFCTAGIDSTNKTYEIFVYAGWNTESGSAAIPLDTIHVLTLPAFHWIQVPYEPRFPRHAHSCISVGGSQILIIGGLDTNTAGTLQATFSTPDPFAQGLAIFDMTALRFADQFTATAPPYVQSNRVKQFYSQSSRTYVKNLDPNVASLMRITHFPNSTASSPTSKQSPASNESTEPTYTSTSTAHAQQKQHLGAILGAAIGGSATLALIATGLIYYRRGHRKSKSSSAGHSPQQQTDSVHELHMDSRPLEADGRSLYMTHEEPHRTELHSNPLRQELQVPHVELWARYDDYGR
ncbi:MAG: hypothetical protein Q9191_001376 [Dirinaria sp. TL-2023a]